MRSDIGAGHQSGRDIITSVGVFSISVNREAGTLFIRETNELLIIIARILKFKLEILSIL